MEQVLPKTVGGTKVHILIGIKITRLQPTLLKVLPSGVGVYLSSFKDVWGSSIMFAGPHKVFSKINKEMSRDSNHAVYSADVNENQEQCNTDLEIREDRLNSIDRIRTSLYFSFENSGEIKETKDVRFDSSLFFFRASLYPSAIEDNIFQEMGFKPGLNL